MDSLSFHLVQLLVRSVAATEGDVIIQLSGNRKFETDYVER